MEDQLPHFIELVDENNVITTFEYRMSLDYNNREYIVLACPEEDTDSGEGDEIVILRVEQDENGDDYYVGIEAEKELQDVFSAVTEIYDH
jgi:uncharacterized protein YrzB (UPF0473 family)